MSERRNKQSGWLLTLAAVFALGSTAYATNPADWTAELGGDQDGAEESPVLGMTAEEFEQYARADGETGEGDEETAEAFVRNRRRFVLREMKFNSDWDCDPTALPAMALQFTRLTGMEAQALVPRKPLTWDSEEIFDWPFVYMTAHFAFNLSEEESANLRRYVEQGGFLYADDCLYGQTFGPAFRGEIARAFPNSPFEPIKLDDPVYGMVLKQKYDFAHRHESGVPKACRNANPFLGLVHNGLMGVLYTPQDWGCAWEISSPPTPSNPLGAGMHGADLEPGLREAAYKVGVNILLFSMLH